MLRGFLARVSSAMFRPFWRAAGSASIKQASGAAVLALATLVAGCTRIELENKAEAYDAAISEASNESILLNAVRASQRMPMSFVSLGQINANPSVGASLNSQFNFERVTGLTTWSTSPTTTVGGGFSTFTMDNLNTGPFMERMRKQISRDLINYFKDLKWPEELNDLLFIASISVKLEVRDRIERAARAKCDSDPGPRTRAICDAIGEQQEARARAQCHEYGRRPFIYNSARDICSMAEFQTFIRESRLLFIDPLKTTLYTRTPHTGLGILYYLGELIAAQNYSAHPYEPKVLIGTSAGLRTVPLFVVRRGVAVPGEAAVHVYHRGEAFFIPRPDLGSIDEARSLQVLDFVAQVISAVTLDKNIPKISTIGLVANR